ncbi:hypothetical protein STEG23_002919, partial [Scotinomys teguina]
MAEEKMPSPLLPLPPETGTGDENGIFWLRNGAVKVIPRVWEALSSIGILLLQ